MAGEELLSLKWNNHQSHFVDILTFLRKKEMFIDATIACGGKVYSAHKFVLSTCSDYFKQIFTRNPSTNPIVFMKDVSCHDIEALLDFMYNGEVNVPQSSLGSLIKTAEGLQIKGLAVPDDPPASRREQDRDKRERESSSSYLENRSPPPKRRIRERISPHRRNSNTQNTATHNRLSVAPPVETTLDENVNTNRNSNSPNVVDDSISSNVIKSGNSNVGGSRRHSMTEPEEGEEDRGGFDTGTDDGGTTSTSLHNNNNRQNNTSDHHLGISAGTIQSKQEEMEIKQEDVVELEEEDDDGDWGGGMMGDGDDVGGTASAGGGGGGNDSLSSADNTVNFSDVLLPHNDAGVGGGSMAANVGDSAMARMLEGHPPSMPKMEAANLQLPDDHNAFEDIQEQKLRTVFGVSTLPLLDQGIPDGNDPPELLGLRHPNSNSKEDLFGSALGMVSPDDCSLFQGPSTSQISQPHMHQSGSSPNFGANASIKLGLLNSTRGGGRRGNIPTSCPLCDRKILFKSELEKHMRTHTGEKPFRCHLCPYKSAQRSNLNVHLRSVHKQFCGGSGISASHAPLSVHHQTLQSSSQDHTDLQQHFLNQDHLIQQTPPSDHQLMVERSSEAAQVSQQQSLMQLLQPIQETEGEDQQDHEQL